MSTLFFTHCLCYKFVSILYLRRLDAGLSPQRPGFETRPVCGLRDGQKKQWRNFSKTRRTSVLPCQWRSDDVPYSHLINRMSLLNDLSNSRRRFIKSSPPPSFYLSLFYNSEHLFDVATHPKPVTQFHVRI
jgi:hypothetical protein